MEATHTKSVESIHNQITDEAKDWYWTGAMHSNFLGRLIKEVEAIFKLTVRNLDEDIVYHLDTCDWHALKTSFIGAVATYNLQTYTTGLLRSIHLEYVNHVYDHGTDNIYYRDDLPGYSYDMLTNFLATWEIFSQLGIESHEE
ncbi:hypothetical protein D9M73_237670 [compost metagenome]